MMKMVMIPNNNKQLSWSVGQTANTFELEEITLPKFTYSYPFFYEKMINKMINKKPPTKAEKFEKSLSKGLDDSGNCWGCGEKGISGLCNFCSSEDAHVPFSITKQLVTLTDCFENEDLQQWLYDEIDDWCKVEYDNRFKTFRIPVWVDIKCSPKDDRCPDPDNDVFDVDMCHLDQNNLGRLTIFNAVFNGFKHYESKIKRTAHFDKLFSQLGDSRPREHL